MTGTGADTAAAKASEAGNAALNKANEVSTQQTGKTLNEHGEVRFYTSDTSVSLGH